MVSNCGALIRDYRKDLKADMVTQFIGLSSQQVMARMESLSTLVFGTQGGIICSADAEPCFSLVIDSVSFYYFGFQKIPS